MKTIITGSLLAVAGLSAVAAADSSVGSNRLCNYYTPSEVDNATIYSIDKDAQSALETWRNGENKLMRVLNRTDREEDYPTTFNFPAIFPTIGLVLLALTFPICLICSIVSCCIPTDKNKKNTQPFKGAAFLFFGLMTVFSLGFAYTFLLVPNSVKYGLQTTTCAAYNGFVIAGNGTTISKNGTNSTFIGLFKGAQQFQNLSYMVSNATAKITNFTVVSMEPLSSDVNKLTSSIEDLIATNTTQFVSPNPFDNSTLPSEYLQSFGPITNKSSVGGSAKVQIDQEFMFTNTSAAIINKFGALVQSDHKYFSKSIERAADELDRQVNGYKKSMRDTDDVLNYASDTSFNVATPYSMLGGASGVILVLTAIAVFFLRKRTSMLSCCFYSVWVILALFTLVALTASIYLTVGGQLAIDTCDIVGGLLTSRYTLVEVFGLNQPTPIQTCLTGNGDWISEYQLYPQVSRDLRSFSLSLSKMTQFSSNLTAPNRNLPAVEAAKNKGVAILAGDASPFAKRGIDEPIGNSLHYLHNWADGSNSLYYQEYYGKCNVSQEDWKMNAAACANSTYPYINPSNATALGQPACLVVSEWTQSQLNDRYADSYFQTCQNIAEKPFDQFHTVEGNILAYTNTLQSYAESAKTIITPVVNSLSTIEDSYKVNGYFKDLSSAVGAFADLSNQVSGLVEAVSNIQGTGVLDQGNCQFIQVALADVFNRGCGSLRPALNQYAFFTGIIGALGLIVTLVAWILAIRIGRKDYEVEEGHGHVIVGYYNQLQVPINQP